MVNFSALQRKKDARPGLEPHSSYEFTAWESRASSGAPMPGILDRYLKSSLIITDAIEKVEFIKWSNNEISHFEIIQYLCVCNVVKVTPKMVNVTPADGVIDTAALVNLVGVLLRVAGYIETLLKVKLILQLCYLLIILLWQFSTWTDWIFYQLLIKCFLIEFILVFKYKISVIKKSLINCQMRREGSLNILNFKNIYIA